MSSRLTAYLLLFATSAIWGFAGPILKYSFAYISPFEFLFWRFLLACLVTLPIMVWYYKKYPLKSHDFVRLAILGFLCTTLNLSLLLWGLSKTSVIEATLIGSLTPLLVVLASSVYLQEKLTKKMQFGLVLAIAGSILAVFQPLLGQGTFFNSFTGNVLIFLGGLAWVGFVLLSKKWEHADLKPFHIVSFSFFIGLVSFFIITVYTQGPDISLAQVPPQVWLPLIYMAVFSSLVAYTAYEIALSKINVSQADMFGYLSAVWAIPLAIVWLKEEFSLISLVSMALIIAGITLAEYRKNLFAPPRPKFRGHHLSQHR